MKQFLLLCTSILTLSAFAQPSGNVLASNSQVGYVSVPDNSTTDFSDSVTVEMWINSCDTTVQNILLGKGWCSGQDQAYSLSLIGSRLQWEWFPVTGNCSSSTYYRAVETGSTIITPGSWYHIAMSHSSVGGVKFYVNGVLYPCTFIYGSSYSTIRNSAQPLLINGYRALSGSIGTGMPGKMDEMRIWKKVRSITEIQGTMNTALTGTETALSAYYRFEQMGTGTGIVVTNSAVATGTVLNGTTGGSASNPFFTAATSTITACLPLGIESPVVNALQVKAYPNPASNRIYIECSNAKELQVSLFDVTGRLLYEAKENCKMIDAEAFPAGLYFLKMESGQMSRTERIVISK
ncbi:MAG: LamG-like jellyroll fold domain-containing protein [Bacteroidia bacterium]